MTDIKRMSLWQSVAMVFSGMVGSGVLFLPHEMAFCGFLGVFSWLIGTLMIYCIFLSFVGVNDYMIENIGNRVPSVLDFLRLVYHEKVVFLLIFGHFIAMSLTSAVTALSFSDYFSGVFPSYHYGAKILASITLFSVFFLNIISFGIANSLNFWLSSIKLMFFLLISILGIIHLPYYSPVFGSVSSLFNGAGISMFAFLGIEFALFASSSIENPRKNVIKATKIALFFSSIIFIGIFIACIVVLPDLSKTKTPVYDCAFLLLGPIGGKIIGSVALLSCLTGLNGRLIIQGNSLREFAKKKFVSKVFGAQTSQGFPWIGSFFSLFISVVIIWMPFKLDLTLFIVTLVSFLYCAIVLSNILLNGLSLMSLLAVLSCCLILYSANLMVLSVVFLNYFIGYVLMYINAKFK